MTFRLSYLHRRHGADVVIALLEHGIGKLKTVIFLPHEKGIWGLHLIIPDVVLFVIVLRIF